MWGDVVNANDDVWRSGLGITPSGALVYVGGPGMSLSDLANVMLRSGVEEGMGLDYGLDWVRSPPTPRARYRDRREQRAEPVVVDARRAGLVLRLVLATRLLHHVAA